MKFYGITSIIFLYGVIACNASSKCGFNRLSDGKYACYNSKNSYDKSGEIVVKGFDHDEADRYAPLSAIRAATVAKKMENKEKNTFSLSAKSNQKYRSGGFGGCKTLSSSLSASHSVTDNNERLQEAVKDLKELSKGERIVPKFEPISLEAHPSPLLGKSLAVDVTVRPARPNRPKCNECGGTTKHAFSCGAVGTGMLGSNSNSYNGLPQVSGSHEWKNFRTSTSFKTNKNPAPISPNFNILQTFHETAGCPGIPFSEQEKLYNNGVSISSSKVPADSVSQHLYRQNVLPPSNQKESVSEAKLYFGPLSHPQNSAKNKTVTSTDEAKLFNVHNPIIEFVTKSPLLLNRKTFDGGSEDGELLESIQRERLYHAINTPDVSTSFQPTFGDLGYTGVQPNEYKFLVRDSSNVPNNNWLGLTEVRILPGQSPLSFRERNVHSRTGTHDCSVDRIYDNENVSRPGRFNDEFINANLGDAYENYKTGRVDSDTAVVDDNRSSKEKSSCCRRRRS